MKRPVLIAMAVLAAWPMMAGAQEQRDRGRPGGGNPGGGNPGGGQPQRPGGGGQPQRPGGGPGGPGGPQVQPPRPGGGGGPGNGRPGGGFNPGSNRPGRPGGDFTRPGGAGAGSRPDRPGGDYNRPGRPGDTNRPGRPGGDGNRPGRPGGDFHRPPSYRPPAGYWHGNNWNRPRVRWNNYVYPRGYSYRRWTPGLFLPALFFAPTYFYTDWASLGLYAPPYGYQWVRYGPDLLLVENYSRRIVEVRYGVFY